MRFRDRTFPEGIFGKVRAIAFQWAHSVGYNQDVVSMYGIWLEWFFGKQNG